MLDVKLPYNRIDMSMDNTENKACEGLESLTHVKVNKIYSRYQNMWKLFMGENSIKTENNNGKFLTFFALFVVIMPHLLFGLFIPV